MTQPVVHRSQPPRFANEKPSEAGFSVHEELEPVGDALRWRCAKAGAEPTATFELWRANEEDRDFCLRMLRFGRRHLGGFVAAGHDDEGLWLVRRGSAKSLANVWRDRGRWAWRDALDIVLPIARSQAVAEAASVFTGALTPSSIAVLGDEGAWEAWLPADDFVAVLFGERRKSAAPRGDTSPKALLWLPPEKLESAVGDSESNRYALGVILYQLLAGEHPFGGAGLRHALKEAARLEPAPFVASVARELPAGLQSLCLKILAPAPTDRPVRSAEVIEQIEDFINPEDPETHAGGEEQAQRSAALRTKRPRPKSRPPASRAPDARASASRASDARASASRAPDARASASRPPGKARRRVLIDLTWLLDAVAQRPLLRWVPVGVALVALAGIVATIVDNASFDGAWFDTSSHSDRERPRLGAVVPLVQNRTTVADCAQCHPRQAAEWSHSVMGHSVKSPLFNALEMLIEEQVGRDRDCPGGAGILRRAEPGTECRDPQTGLRITGAGGEHWCVNCHAPGENLRAAMPAWQGGRSGDPRTRRPIKDQIEPATLEGISCAFCHQVHGPVGRRGAGGYEGNPDWFSFKSGQVFASRPEDRSGLFGIANSGYALDPAELLLAQADPSRVALAAGGRAAAHARPTAEAKAYLSSSEFCGSCHDVRLFGTDVLGAAAGEHFKRLRNAYTEWRAYAAQQTAAGQRVASCQDCHMSSFPGVCVASADARDDGVCPDGTRFEPHEPGRRVVGLVASTSAEQTAVTKHYFGAVDLPLAEDIRDDELDQDGLDLHGVPLSAKRRRNMLLKRSLSLTIDGAARVGGALHIPIVIENIGAGHRVPAGFSQEREIWVHLAVQDGDGRVLYEVGRVDRNEQDLPDKTFLRVTTDPDRLDGAGRPVGLFGADVADGPDVPRWSPEPMHGGSEFRGRGLINFQNGFLRCVSCIGVIDDDGECQPLPGQEQHRAARFADGDYDIDTGECGSNLSGRRALIETYFPVGALDADRGLVKGPDAIIDTRSLPPGAPVRYIYELATRGRPGPFKVRARLMFRSFPPFLVRAFADYEQQQAARGRRPTGALVTRAMLRRLERVEVARAGIDVE